MSTPRPPVLPPPKPALPSPRPSLQPAAPGPTAPSRASSPLPPPLPRISPAPSPRTSAASVSLAQGGAVVRREPLKLSTFISAGLGRRTLPRRATDGPCLPHSLEPLPVELPDHKPSKTKHRRAHSFGEADARTPTQELRPDVADRRRHRRERGRERLEGPGGAQNAMRPSGGGGGFLDSVKGLFGLGGAPDLRDGSRRHDDRRRPIGRDDYLFDGRYHRDDRRRVVSDDHEWRFEQRRGPVRL